MHHLKGILLIFLFCGWQANAQRPDEYHLLIGTYASEGKPNGIHVFRFNANNGELVKTQPVWELSNASFLTISHDRKNVYALSDGHVNSFSFHAATGALTFMNRVPASGPAYVTVDRQKRMVFCGNYSGGNVMAIRLREDGSFEPDEVQIVQHEGSSINKERQEKPHVHAAVLSPDEHYLMVPDLGNDRIYRYRVGDPPRMLSSAKLPYIATAPGSGPRHLTFHPNGKYAYAVLELAGAVMVLDVRKEKLREMQTISMVDLDFKGRLSGADIHVSPDGRYLYASNRGDANEIAIYSIDKQGKLMLINRQSVLGKMPRNFAIDPTGKYVLVANQNSNEIIIFLRDQKTGMLTPSGRKIEVEKPVCLKFALHGE
jgi:6-phosphogluconolactonase